MPGEKKKAAALIAIEICRAKNYSSDLVHRVLDVGEGGYVPLEAQRRGQTNGGAVLGRMYEKKKKKKKVPRANIRGGATGAQSNRSIAKQHAGMPGLFGWSLKH